jgi:hypothetical protein
MDRARQRRFKDDARFDILWLLGVWVRRAVSSRPFFFFGGLIGDLQFGAIRKNLRRRPLKSGRADRI